MAIPGLVLNCWCFGIKLSLLPANLLLNTGPLPDGSIHPEDVATLKEVGKRITKNGFPTG